MSNSLHKAQSAVPLAIPILLSYVAGYIDSIGFLALFGLFTAQVTGSFIIAGAELVRDEPGSFAKLMAIPAFFAASMLATTVIRVCEKRDWNGLSITLALESLMLIGLLLTGLIGTPLTHPDATAALGAGLFGLFAMGFQSTIVRVLMSGVASTNVMTSNLTHLAVDATDIFLNLGRSDEARVIRTPARRRFSQVFPLALSFLVGAAFGALAFAEFGLGSIAIAIAIVSALVLWAALWRRPKRLAALA